MEKRTIKKVHTWLRAAIQLLYFCFIPSAFTAAFAGVKDIFTKLGAGQSIELTSFVTVLLVLCAYTIVFGRFFCGYACAFGSLGDGVRAVYVFVCKKAGKKPFRLDESVADKLSLLKYVILTAIAIMCFLGAYAKVRGASPWDVFSMVHAGNFEPGGYIAGTVLLVLIIAGMCIQERFFCRFLCPMGAVFAVLPVLPLFSLRRDRKSCIRGCRACTVKCPADIALPDDGGFSVMGDCFQCGKCADICPKANIRCGISRLTGNEIWFTLFRGAILLALFLWLEV